MDSSTATIDLRLDDRPHRLPAGTTLADLVAGLGHQPHDIGTAVNGSFVARAQRAGCVLRAGDAVLLFHPIVGG
jgi:thiamine biosynthesis protein ThiS